MRCWALGWRQHDVGMLCGWKIGLCGIFFRRDFTHDMFFCDCTSALDGKQQAWPLHFSHCFKLE